MEEKKIVYDTYYIRLMGDTPNRREFLRDNACERVLKIAQQELAESKQIALRGTFGAGFCGAFVGLGSGLCYSAIQMDTATGILAGLSTGAIVFGAISALSVSKLITAKKNLKGWLKVVEQEKNKPLEKLEMNI